jgi:uncharacterized protein
MRLRCRPLPLAALAVILLAISAPARAVDPPVPATPPDYVVDLAGVIDSASRARLSALLRELEEKTTAQVVVLTLRSLAGESLEAFSIDLAHNRWKLGQKGKDNGVLITLALGERRYRIEVGYGLESVLPDSSVGSIGREMLVPAFRAGDYGGGLVVAADEIASRIAAASGVALSGAPAAGGHPARPERTPGPLGKFFVLLLMVGFLWLLIRHPGIVLALLLSSRSRGSHGSWGGGGFGGGGFGGGGGGGFGGGGASGSW